MLRTFLMSVALLGLVAMANQAEARGRRGGCSGGSCQRGSYNTGSCGVSYGGCQGGACFVPSAAPAPTSGPMEEAPPAPPAAQVQPQSSAAPVATVQSGYGSTSRSARWRSGGRRFR